MLQSRAPAPSRFYFISCTTRIAPIKWHPDGSPGPERCTVDRVTRLGDQRDLSELARSPAVTNRIRCSVTSPGLDVSHNPPEMRRRR